MTSLLSELHKQLQWPKSEHIVDPPGYGPSVYGRLARLKIEAPLSRELGNDGVRVGVLVGNPYADTSEAPIALVCEFNRALTPSRLNQTRKLAWNFCRTPLLITLEPQLVRVWSCYEKPEGRDGRFPVEPIIGEHLDPSLDLSLLSEALHWAHLASGQFLALHAKRFHRNQRADILLLENLRYVREKLTRDLDEGIAHDLLARVIFIQFLFDRKDAQGNAALSADKFASLHEKGLLSQPHEDLSSILGHKADSFALFRWLNERFNGDLFPTNYSEEEDQVKETHLEMLADFVSGRLKMENGQYLLWPHYSFDTIPLEFVSSIYEEFVTKRKDDKQQGVGEHYTRPFLVDFVLDKVLPWGGIDYDLKILDPCCGSAIFLVKAFQRLVQRWRNANPGKEPPASFLRDLIEKNLFGVDDKLNAVRVASFSLYLAMCDEIDPKYYWTRVRFPSLREKRIRTADFFSEDIEGICTCKDAGRYDLIVGNAPWGKDSVTEKARQWAAKKQDDGSWPIADKQIGTLFLAKAALLCKPNGRICMIQPAGSLLFNINGPAKKFRKKLFMKYKVDEVVNLSALRFAMLFANAIGTVCIINMRTIPPDGEAIAYWSPKQTHTQEEQVRVVIDEQDLNWVWPEEAANDPIVWPSLTLGGRRDYELLKKIRSHYPTIKSLSKKEICSNEIGFTRGGKKSKPHPHPNRLKYRSLEDHRIWDNCPLVVDSAIFPFNENSSFYREKKLEVFRLPMLVMKLSWSQETKRFKAIIVQSDQDEYLLVSQSFVILQAEGSELLKSIAFFSNSQFAVYFHFLSSGRVANFIPSLRVDEIQEIPVPCIKNASLSALADLSYEDIDRCVFEAFKLNIVEKALAEDFFNLTLPDFKATDENRAPGRSKAWSTTNTDENLATYCDWFLRVLEAGFGSDKAICATIYRPINPGTSSFCMVGVHFGWQGCEHIHYKDLTDGNLLRVLDQCTQDNWQNGTSIKREAIYYHRVSRIYQNLSVTDDKKERNIPTVFLIKPNQIRYWSRSTALRDADNVSADIMKYGSPGGSTTEPLHD